MRGLKSLCPLSWQKNDCTLLTLWVFYLNEHVVVFLVTKHNFLFTDLETPKTKSKNSVPVKLIWDALFTGIYSAQNAKPEYRYVVMAKTLS